MGGLYTDLETRSTDTDTGLGFSHGGGYYDPGNARFLIRALGGVNAYSGGSGLGALALDLVQVGLDLFGFLPGVGEPADALSGAIDLLRGDYLGAGLSAAAMVPGAGWGTGATRIARRLGKLQSKSHILSVVQKDVGLLEGVKPFQVGRYRPMIETSRVGDALELHHVPQGKPAKQVIPGYDYEQGTAIALPRAMHRGLPGSSRLTGEYGGSARQLISIGLRDLFEAGVPHESLRELARMIRQTYPEVFRR